MAVSSGAPFALGICSPGWMAGLQIAVFCQLLKLRTGISPHVIFAELTEAQPARRGSGLGGLRSLASCTGWMAWTRAAFILIF